MRYFILTLLALTFLSLFNSTSHALSVALNPDDGAGMIVTDTVTLPNYDDDGKSLDGGSVSISNSSTDDAKIPLILVHGIDRNHLPGDYFHSSWYNFVKYFQSNANLSGRYKLYIVMYQSNVVSIDRLGNDLGSLITQLDSKTHGLQGKKFVILAHSMGGLISRAFMNTSQASGQLWGSEY